MATAQSSAPRTDKTARSSVAMQKIGFGHTARLCDGYELSAGALFNGLIIDGLPGVSEDSDHFPKISEEDPKIFLLRRGSSERFSVGRVRCTKRVQAQ